jgi:3-hydroxybutyryl-CoA dehydrogenase
MSEPITSLGVVGGGFMGAGIAETAAFAQIPVVVRELPQYLDGARQRLQTSLDRAVKRGKRDEYAPPPLMKRMIAAGRLGRKSGRGFYDYAATV